MRSPELFLRTIGFDDANLRFQQFSSGSKDTISHNDNTQYRTMTNWPRSSFAVGYLVKAHQDSRAYLWRPVPASIAVHHNCSSRAQCFHAYPHRLHQCPPHLPPVWVGEVQGASVRNHLQSFIVMPQQCPPHSNENRFKSALQ